MLGKEEEREKNVLSRLSKASMNHELSNDYAFSHAHCPNISLVINSFASVVSKDIMHEQFYSFESQ